MKRITYPIEALILAGAIFAVATVSALAQGPSHLPSTKSRMEYHGGRVMIGASNVYFIWYGCWSENCGGNGSTNTISLVETFATSIGSTPYAVINTTYPNDFGQAPSGSILFGGYSFEPNYSRGTELTIDDIQAIVADQIDNNHVPGDPAGIYVVISSADVGATAAGFCTAAGTPPHHGHGHGFLGEFRYAFLGNPNRCPAIAGPQFTAANGSLLPTPNNDFAADVIASDLAHVLNATLTNPSGDGWYDRYGFENADKCLGTFGTTYTTANGARANVRWGARDYLVQQNWVNDRKGRCAMQLFQ